MTWQEEALTATCALGSQYGWAGNYYQRNLDTFSTDGNRLLIVDGAWFTDRENTKPAPPIEGVISGFKPSVEIEMLKLRDWASDVPMKLVCALCGEPPDVPQPEEVECSDCHGEGECSHCGEECRTCDGDGFTQRGCDSHGVRSKLADDKNVHGLILGQVFDRRLFSSVVGKLPGETAKVSVGDHCVRFDGDGWVFVVMGVKTYEPVVAPELVLP